MARVSQHLHTRRLGDDLARHRLRHRVHRLDRVIDALERRAQGYETPPRALSLAMDDFRRERDRLRAQCEHLRGPDVAPIAV